MTPKVSIVMSVCDRPTILKNSLDSYSCLSYPDCEFLFYDNGSVMPNQEQGIIQSFGESCSVPIRYTRFDTVRAVNRVWNQGLEEASGDFIIFAQMDFILSSKDLVEKMLGAYQEGLRVSILPYFLSEKNSMELSTIDWRNNPKLIETLTQFWILPDAAGRRNMDITSAGIFSYITGQYRRDWEYIGGFRKETYGHLWLDQDLHKREQVLKKPVITPSGICAYHQWHPTPSVEQRIPNMSHGYIYRNEREARLLEPAVAEPPIY